MSRIIKDLTGQKFNRLTAISENGRTSSGTVLWSCICDCGNIINVESRSLVSYNTKSCGCLKIENGIELGKSNITHGHSYTAEYTIWGSMIQRCTNPKDLAYANYGSRGILVCERWLHSFENFLADMGPRPSPDHSIDRRENDGNYEPNNCKWSTRIEQQNNKRNTVFVTYRGKDYTIAESAREYNMPYNVLAGRLKLGWSVERAIETLVV